MRIDKFISSSKKYSRKEIKKLAKDGLIKVNGLIFKDVATHINEESDVITVNGEVINYKEFIYLMVNKPSGVISATDDNFHETVIDLLSAYYKVFELFPVGRLDIDTEGLMFLTNDGGLAHNMLSPKKHVDKEYYVIVDGEIKEEHVEKFKNGITLDDGYLTLPANLKVSDDNTEAFVTIKEGKFHQIKRMFADCGLKVKYLKRIRMGSLVLDDSLEIGQFRELTLNEERSIKNGYCSDKT